MWPTSWLHNLCRGGGWGGSEVEAVRNGKSFFGRGAHNRAWISEWGTISEIAHKWGQWQSEVGNFFFLGKAFT